MIFFSIDNTISFHYISGGCSHGKAVTYFIESITNPHAYPSVECLTFEEAAAGSCTGTHTAEMGNSESYK